MLGLESYTPKSYIDKDEFLREKETFLHSLTGQNLKQILWVVDDEGEWFDDLPVVLKFERASVAVCCFGFDELALDADMLNADEKIDWGELNLTWREFASFKDFKITGFELIMDEMTTEPYGKISHILAGIKFHAKLGWVAVLNGLDKNVVEVEYGSKI